MNWGLMLSVALGVFIGGCGHVFVVGLVKGVKNHFIAKKFEAQFKATLAQPTRAVFLPSDGPVITPRSERRGPRSREDGA